MDVSIRSAQALGLTSSLVLAGVNLGASHLTVPLLYSMPIPISTPFFREFYTRGALSLVPLSIVSASSSALVAYLVPSQRGVWAAAAVATLSQIPWTLFGMMPTNNRLNAIASDKHGQEKTSSEEVVALLKKWRWMNILRGLLALTGGLIGVSALMRE